MKRTKRLLSVFLTLCLLLGMLPTTARAASALEITQQPTADNNYTVKATCEGAITSTVTILSQEEQATADWLADQDHMLTLGPVTVTADNAKDILGDGKASFALVDGTPTLTLNGVNVTKGIEQDGGTIGLTCSDALTIVLAEGSDNTITLTDDVSMGIGIGSQYEGPPSPVFLTVTGKGTLTVDVTGSFMCMGVATKYGVQVTGGAKLTAKASASAGSQCFGLFIQEEGDLQVSGGGVVRLSGTGTAAAIGGSAPQIPLEKGYSIRGSTAANDFTNLTDASLGDGIIMIGNEITKSVVIAPAEPAHSHPVCGETCSHSGAHEDVTWKELTAAMLNSSEPLPSGNYYLANDITVTGFSLGKINTVRTVNLCLSGHTLTCTRDTGEGYRSISVFYNCTWNICDCGEGGQIAFSGNKGFGIDISDSSALNLYGGKLVTEKKELIKSKGTVNLYGGGVTAQTYSIVQDGAPATLTLSGAPEISGSLLLKTSAGASVADAKVDATSYAGNTLTVEEDSLTDTKAGAYAIKVSDGSKDKFTLTNAGYAYQYKDGGLMIYKPHAHVWATDWSEDETGHWHACTVAGCTIDYATCGEAGAAYGLHVYDNDQDTDCNTCGYERTIIKGEVDNKGAPGVTVTEGSLEALVDPTTAPGQTVTVKLTVEKKEEADAEGKDEIKNLITAGQKDDVLYLDLSLLKITESAGGVKQEDSIQNASKVLGIVVPYTFTGKKDVMVYRYHGGAAESLEEKDTKADGTFSLNKNGGTITIYASKFSTYAIAYTPDSGGNQPPSGGGGTGGGGGGYVPPTYPVELPASTPGGKLTASPKSASSGATVTLTPTPDEGYALGGVTVTDRNGKPVAVTAGKDGRYTFTMPSGGVTIKAEFVKRQGGYATCPRDSSCPIWPYTDASPAAWYHDALHYCLENGLMKGYGQGLLGPGQSVSRAEFVQMLYNREGRPAVGGFLAFEDVPDGAWYGEAVRWASIRGVTGGYGNGQFGPNRSITRQELAVMLHRYAGSPAATDKELRFADADKVSAYAREALGWAVENGIVQGKSGGILDPGGNATRAEAAAMLQRFCGKEK